MTEGGLGRGQHSSWGALGFALRDLAHSPPALAPTQPVNAGPRASLSSIFPPGKPPHLTVQLKGQTSRGL